jgi:5-methylcytosine-specific restriction endonuclease McrA
MPIRPENQSRYPKNWPQISRDTRAAAGNKCQKCNAPNGQLVYRFQHEDYHFEPSYMLDDGHIYSAEDGRLLDLQPPSFITDVTVERWVKIVLTVAHLDHQPENCDPSNLRAWCQRCHNAYDAPMRRKGTRMRARSSLAIADLFGGA